MVWCDSVHRKATLTKSKMSNHFQIMISSYMMKHQHQHFTVLVIQPLGRGQTSAVLHPLLPFWLRASSVRCVDYVSLCLDLQWIDFVWSRIFLTPSAPSESQQLLLLQGGAANNTWTCSLIPSGHTNRPRMLELTCTDAGAWQQHTGWKHIMWWMKTELYVFILAIGRLQL